MLPDIGAGELLLIAIVALVVVGPKDLPMLLRRLGQFTSRLRGMAAEFRASFDEMGRQSELDDLRKEVEALRSGRLLNEEMGRTDAQAVMREIETGLSQGDIQLHPSLSNPYAAAQSLAEPEPVPTAAALPARSDPVAAAPRVKAPRIKAAPEVAGETPSASSRPRASRAKASGAKPAGDSA